MEDVTIHPPHGVPSTVTPILPVLDADGHPIERGLQSPISPVVPMKDVVQFEQVVVTYDEHAMVIRVKNYNAQGSVLDVTDTQVAQGNSQST
jgi:hypothetical protein